MGITLGSGLGGRLLEWWGSGRKEKVSKLGSAAEPCKKVRGFYSNSYGISVTEALILFIAYHTAAPHHTVRGPCGEARAVLPTVAGCRPCPPYPCQVGRMTSGPSMLMPGRLRHIGSATSTGLLPSRRGDVAAKSTCVISSPPREDLLEVPE
ncbi:hypothetical protein GW17_00014633 [Ensete ventricosum]|nr:hypothetical protein GW17_00014633 [Ensete ventricosum]